MPPRQCRFQYRGVEGIVLLLRAVAAQARQSAQTMGRRRLAVQKYFTMIRLTQAGQRRQQRALAGAVAPQNSQRASAQQGKGKITAKQLPPDADVNAAKL